MARPPPPPSRLASPRPPHPNEGRASFSDGSTRRRGDAEIKDIRAERAELAEKKGGEAANLIFSAPPRLRVNKDLCVLCALCANSVRLPVLTRALRSRSEEHTSELQSLMRFSYAVFCLKIKT